MNALSKLSFIEQVKFYIKWCKDNNRQPKEAKSLQDYFNEIKELEEVKPC